MEESGCSTISSRSLSQEDSIEEKKEGVVLEAREAEDSEPLRPNRRKAGNSHYEYYSLYQ